MERLNSEVAKKTLLQVCNKAVDVKTHSPITKRNSNLCKGLGEKFAIAKTAAAQAVVARSMHKVWRDFLRDY